MPKKRGGAGPHSMHATKQNPFRSGFVEVDIDRPGTAFGTETYTDFQTFDGVFPLSRLSLSQTPPPLPARTASCWCIPRIPRFGSPSCAPSIPPL